MEWDYRKILSGEILFTDILLQEYDPEKKALVGEAKKIFTGSPIGGTEGPHLYRHNGYYYLMCAKGGTGWFHAVTLARSRELTGPYEICPHNPVLTSWEGSRDPKEIEKALAKKDLGTSFLKKAGHASLVEGPDNRWFLAHLCGRNLRGNALLPPGTGDCDPGSGLGKRLAETEKDGGSAPGTLRAIGDCMKRRESH